MSTKLCEECQKEVKQLYASKYYEDYWLCSECRDEEKKPVEIIICENCGDENPSNEKVCGGCGIKLEESFIRKTVEDVELEKELRKIIVTTTHTIDGRKIVKYLDVISTEKIEGLGMLKDIGADIRNMFGGSVGGYEKALKEMKEKAFLQLREQAYELGANAIVGIDIDYGDLKGSMLMLVVSGTAVITETTNNEKTKNALNG